jgi:ubiquitin C-terminal hydrolase
MNAALQCLLHVPQLVNFVRSDMFEGCLAHKRKNACDFASAFAELAKEYWSSPREAMSTQRATEAFMRIHRSFRGKRHKHDAGEALLLCVDALHSAMGNVQRIHDHPVPLEGQEETDAWERHVCATGYSPIVDMFAGQRKIETGREQFTSLTLDPHATVEKSFEDIQFTRLPLILMTTLKKNETKQFVGYGDELVLHDAKFRVTYRLFAVLMHHGSSAEGHWTALAQHRGEWKHFDDASETAVADLNNIIQKDATMLLYKRVLD